MCEQKNKQTDRRVNNLVTVLEQHSVQIIFPDKIIAITITITVYHISSRKCAMSPTV